MAIFLQDRSFSDYSFFPFLLRKQQSDNSCRQKLLSAVEIFSEEIVKEGRLGVAKIASSFRHYLKENIFYKNI